MELWNDYEGKLLDGQYRLERLIGPKGRSAFFTTTDAGGSAALVRVIESLNDEDEILTRWNAVRGIEEPHVLRILGCNKTQMDGVHLVYAVIEPTDAELSKMLRERALTVEETREVAVAVVGALEALHARGLVHEHVDAESVFAVGETVKLRGDCVREAPEGVAGETLRRRDAHDLAMLVGHALTQRRDSGQAKLPRPFDDFVKNGMAGTWGLKEMGTAVRPLVPAGVVAALPTKQEAAPRAAPSVPVKAELPVPVRREAAEGKSVSGPAAAEPVVAARSSARAVAEALTPGVAPSEQLPMRRMQAEGRIVLEPEESTRPRTAVWAAVVAGVVLLLALIWHFAHGEGMTAAASAPVSKPVSSAVPASVPVKPSAATQSSRGRGSRVGTVAAATVGGAAGDTRVVRGSGPAGSQWRLVAFTYNRPEQAQHKAAEISQAHPELKPEVFTPSGRAPYLVALGGWMSVDQAKALRDKARGEGLPHDIYTQNYRGH